MERLDIAPDAYGSEAFAEVNARVRAVKQPFTPELRSEGPFDIEVTVPQNGPGIYDADELIVHHLPPFAFASSPLHRLGAIHVAEAFSTPVVTVSAPTLHPGYPFRMNKESYFTPYKDYLEAVDRALGKLEIPLGRVAFMGMSQGASIALAHAAKAVEDRKVPWIMAGEPPDVHNRSVQAINRDLHITPSAFFDTMAATGLLDTFLAMYGINTEGKDVEDRHVRRRLKRSFTRKILTTVAMGYAKNRKAFKAVLSDQNELSLAAGKATLHVSLAKIIQHEDTTLMLARAEHSTATPNGPFDGQIKYEVTRYGPERVTNLYLATLQEANHAVAHNPGAVAHLGLLARSFAEKA